VFFDSCQLPLGANFRTWGSWLARWKYESNLLYPFDLLFNQHGEELVKVNSWIDQLDSLGVVRSQCDALLCWVLNGIKCPFVAKKKNKVTSWILEKEDAVCGPSRTICNFIKSSMLCGPSCHFIKSSVVSAWDCYHTWVIARKENLVWTLKPKESLRHATLQS
jgi:hypothetical protein